MAANDFSVGLLRSWHYRSFFHAEQSLTDHALCSNRLNVPPRGGTATGVGSVSEAADDDDDFDADPASLKDVTTAKRRKRKLTLGDDATSTSTSGEESVYSTVIVKKRKKKNSVNGTSAEDSSGTKLVWTL